MQPMPGGVQPMPMGPGGPQAFNSGPIIVNIQCQIEALPKVSNVIGTVVDTDGDAPITNASVRIRDPKNRELELKSGASGNFRFENVPQGTAKLSVSAPGYLTSVLEVSVEGQQELRAQISLNKRPAKPNVVVTAREIKLKNPVHFQHDSADILPDSMFIVEELADVLREKTEIALVEIQGHTDNTGEEAYNRRLSQERADAVKEALMLLDVEGSRLTAKGYGRDRPLVPNVSDANRARNRRVQLIILERN
jgi:outer membrane protein OmpA-like peptidoglycan-associated protein